MEINIDVCVCVCVREREKERESVCESITKLHPLKKLEAVIY